MAWVNEVSKRYLGYTFCYPKTGFTSWWEWSQKTQPSQSAGEGRIYYYLQQVRRIPGIFPKAMTPQQQELGKFSANGTCIFLKRFEQRRIQHRIGGKSQQSPSLVDWGQEGQHPLSVLHLGGGLSSCRTQRYFIMYIPWGGTRALLYHCLLFDCLFSVPAFLCSLEILGYWDLFKGKHCGQA